MKLSDVSMKRFHPTKQLKDNTERINYISYSGDGKQLITSADDDQMIIYDLVTGMPSRTIFSKKYGASLIHFTHSATQAIHGSNKLDDSLRYLSLHDNKYIRYYGGHTKTVVSLSLSPVDDTFLSGSLDNTIRLWDLRLPTCQGVMHVNGRPVCNFDPEGLIFAAGIDSQCLKLYDQRNLATGPFVTFTLVDNPTTKGMNDSTTNSESHDWTDLQFSPDGRFIGIATNGPHIYLVDAFRGTTLFTFTVSSNAEYHLPLSFSFTPDSQYILCGTPDGRVLIWSTTTGGRIGMLHALESNSPQEPIHCVAFNPKFALFSTASTYLTFWLHHENSD